METPFGHEEGLGGAGEREEKEATKTAGLINTCMVYFCVFFHCCTTEALGIWIHDSVEELDPREAMHSLCFLGF